jgi:hypothetical protein
MDIQRHTLWLRWIVANAVGELIGLGTTFAVGFAIFSLLGEPRGTFGAIAMLLLLTASGSVEGVVVGLSQWWAMGASFPRIARRSWVGATLLGALAAWAFGSIPSTLMSMGQENTAQPPPEPETAFVLILAGGLGALAGIVLALPQALVLRRSVEKSWLWIPANSAAWLVGIPIIFAAVDLVQKLSSILGQVAVFSIALLLTGAVVGAVHGLVLVRLAHGK